MSESLIPEENRGYQERITQAVIRLALLAFLAYLCLRVLQPFINPIIGGIVIAIALRKPYDALTRWVRGRRGLSATLLVGGILLALILPTLALGASLVQTAAHLSDTFEPENIEVPPPPESVSEWPLIGEPVYDLWHDASRNLESVLVKASPYLKDVGLWIVETMGDLGFGLVMFIIAIIIGGALLPVREKGVEISHRVGTIVAGKRGPELADLVGESVQSVIRGVIGVAVIQAVAAGLGMLAVGVPGAGLWALLLLLIAVMQLPTLLVLVPVAIYVWYANSTGPAVLFTIWAIIVGGSDNILKPMLMGRGSKTPMLVLFIGSLGGFIAGGLLGLFIGAVVLSMGYTLFMAWLEESTVDPAAATAVSEESAPGSSPEST